MKALRAVLVAIAWQGEAEQSSALREARSKAEAAELRAIKYSAKYEGSADSECRKTWQGYAEPKSLDTSVVMKSMLKT